MGWNYLSIPRFNDATVEVCEWISDFIPHCTGHVTTLLGVKLTQVNKRGPWTFQWLCARFALDFVVVYFYPYPSRLLYWLLMGEWHDYRNKKIQTNKNKTDQMKIYWFRYYNGFRHMHWTQSQMKSIMTSSNGNTFRVTGPLRGNSAVTGEFPSQRPVERSFDVVFNLRLNKQLSKQSWGYKWFETPSRSLWRHCNVTFDAKHYRNNWLTLVN